ncbi:hypothetical protein IGI04_017577 [Brassica rapa subsp. trilocularis]|uniref:Transmembrane protein n=1 Tax=Brassica rapa subsp. trilocularis TaxID=1813537 RepID=A0ABQ7MAG5_BRACM|nr:hypothetical protein IGI04_017577 [Brassica rapa subsp. trilocularis]
MDSLRNLLPFSTVGSDLRESKELVQRLDVPESTKAFVFAIKVPEHDSTIYLLSVQNLSQRSATDAECLIRELRPDAVVAQVNPSPFGEDDEEGSIPTSAFKVLARCLKDESLSKEKYQSVARNLVIKEIFGKCFNGPLLAAKRVAEEIGSTFMVLESPFLMDGLTKSPLGSTRFQISNDQRSPMQRLLSSHITHLSNEIESEVPPFALSVYNLLVELHNIFNDLPAMRKALDTATKMLSDVNNGEAVDAEALSEVYLFRLAVEGLRIALNKGGRLNNIRNLGGEVQFSKLSSDDKAYALMADDLRSQAKKFKSIVAVIDAGNLAGLRRHWRTRVPQEVKAMSTEHTVQDSDSKIKPVVAVGGALTLSKSSRFLNRFLTRKASAFTKMVYPSALSAERIRGVTQYILTSAEGTSLESMRAAFYAMMMRNRRLAKPMGALPMVVFGAGLASFSGLIYCEERIECAAVTLPSAPSIAKLGRGVQNLREASLEVTRRGNNGVHNAMQGLSQRVRNLTLNYLNFKPNLESKTLVQRLDVPESTKNFVFAIKVPEHDSTIYLLSVHNLSQRSATDAECLIRELRPDAVVTQVNPSAFGEAEEEIVLVDGSTGSIPTSVFKVLTRCVLDESLTKAKYQRIAGNLVMEEIFGTGFNKHLLAVEKVAGEVGSTFVVLDSPFVMEGLTKSLTTQAYHGSALINVDQQALMHRLLSSSHIDKRKSRVKVPKFARSTYYLLVEIHNTLFDDLPAIRKALQSAKKIFSDVDKGESIDTKALTEAYLFRSAVESLRVASNDAGRIPIENLGTEVQFSKLSFTDKSYALMAVELRSQAKKFKKIVAVVDAGNLAGLRRHWRTCVPQQVKDMSTEHTGFDSNDSGAGSGALTLSKAILASPVFKISTIKTLVNPFLTHKAMPFAFTKVAYPSTVMTLMAPWFASSGAQPLSWGKPSLSARHISALTMFGLSSARRTSFSAMRASFYTMMMRKRLVKPIGTLPRVVFGASLVIYAGLHLFGDGIECAALTLPSASSIAKLGRGIQNLSEASLDVTRRGNNRVQNTRDGLTQRLSNLTLTINFKTKFGS